MKSHHMYINSFHLFSSLYLKLYKGVYIVSIGGNVQYFCEFREEIQVLLDFSNTGKSSLSR